MEELQEFCSKVGNVDNRLKNWQKWLNIHKKQYTYLNTKINRNPSSLLMNRFINELRYINQEKTFMDKAKTYIKGDRYRGHPNFWKFPLSLKCHNKTLPPCYTVGQEYDRTKPDPVPPFPNYICTADTILFEQGLKNVGTTGIAKWKKSRLIKKKLAKLQRNIRTKFYQPYFKDLIVVGKQFHQHMLPDLSVNSPELIKNDDCFEGKTSEFISGIETKQDESKNMEITIRENDKNNLVEHEFDRICINITLSQQPVYKSENNHTIKKRISSIKNVKQVQARENISEIIIINSGLVTATANNCLSTDLRKETDKKLLKSDTSLIVVTKNMEIQVNLSDSSLSTLSKSTLPSIKSTDSSNKNCKDMNSFSCKGSQDTKPPNTLEVLTNLRKPINVSEKKVEPLPNSEITKTSPNSEVKQTFSKESMIGIYSQNTKIIMTTRTPPKTVVSLEDMTSKPTLNSEISVKSSISSTIKSDNEISVPSKFKTKANLFNSNIENVNDDIGKTSSIHSKETISGKDVFTISDTIQEITNEVSLPNFRDKSQQVNITVSGTLISDQINQSDQSINQIKNLFNFNVDNKETQVSFSRFEGKNNKPIIVTENERGSRPADSEKLTNVDDVHNEIYSDQRKTEDVLQNFEIILLYGNCEVNRRYERVIELVNENPVCIRYEWQQWPMQHGMKPFKQLQFSPKFFFNSNSGVIAPYGRNTIKVHFKSKQTGVFKDNWEFKTNPPTLKGKHSIIHFEAIVLNQMDESKWKTIENYLGHCVINSFAKERVNKMINEIKPEQLTNFPYCDKLLEEEIFLHNNPDLFYESNSVHVLKDLNQKITFSNWDFSVKNLRQNIFKVESTELKEQYLGIFTKHVNVLMKPTQKSVLYNKKYKTVNEILCSLVEKIDHEGSYLKKCIGITELINSELSSNILLDSKYSELQDSRTKRRSRSSYNRSKKSFELQSVSESLREEDKSLKSKFKTEQYIQAFYIKTYNHLSVTIEEIAAALESISFLQKKSIFSSLGK